MHVDFVIKFLHGIRAWALSYSEQCYFLARFEGGNLDCLFSIEKLTGRWLFASSMRTKDFQLFAMESQDVDYSQEEKNLELC